VPAYAPTAADVEPLAKRPRRGGRITAPEPDRVSASEFEQMKRDLEIEPEPVGHDASPFTKRLSQREATPTPGPARKAPGQDDETQPPPTDRPAHAPDAAENEGVAPVQKPKRRATSHSRNRRHGRRR